MESYLTPEDTKVEFCRVEIKEEVSFELIEEQSYIGGVKEECAVINDMKEKACFDIKQDQSFPSDMLREENLLANEIKTEDLNNIDINNDNDFIKEEEEIDYVWPEDAAKETDPLALLEIKYDSEGVEGSDPLDESSEVGENRTTQVGDHIKSKMSANTNNFSSTSNLYTKTTYTCELCNICFNCQVRYKKHLLNHSESELLSCAHCSYKTLYKDKLISHKKQHLGEVKKQYTCNVCFYKCFHSGHLKRHMRTHTGEKPYSCSVCSYKCSQSGALTIHMRIHTGENPYSCNMCSYKCSQSVYLKRHMITHTGEKPYSCSVCSYKCSQSVYLKRHMLTHTGEKPYVCTVCPYKCSQSGALTIHMRTHTGEEPYICKICSYKCKRSGALKRHMRTHK